MYNILLQIGYPLKTNEAHSLIHMDKTSSNHLKNEQEGLVDDVCAKELEGELADAYP